MRHRAQCKRFHVWVIEQRDAIAAIPVRAEQRPPGEKLSILEILLCTDTKQLRGMRANVRKPGDWRDTFSPQCANEQLFRHRACLSPSEPSCLSRTRQFRH